MGEEETVKTNAEGKRVKDKYVLNKFRLPGTTCQVCDGALVMGGPIWNKPMHNQDFVKRLLEVARRN